LDQKQNLQSFDLQAFIYFFINFGGEGGIAALQYIFKLTLLADDPAFYFINPENLKLTCAFYPQ